MRGDDPPDVFEIEEDTPDSFLSFLNPHAPFGAGIYQVYILPQAAGTGSYEGEWYAGTEKQEDAEHFSGSWDSGVVTDWNTTENIPITLGLEQAGGFSFSVRCSLPCNVFLTRNGYQYLAKNSQESSGNNTVELEFDNSLIDSADYAKAYYDAIDPDGLRATLSEWQVQNIGPADTDTHAIFRDTKDLGYGRNMFAGNNSEGNFSAFVKNYIVSLTAGDPSSYGPLNIFAAEDENREYHIGTNAVEFSDNILKFFTYAGENSDGSQRRLEAADLDGRGVRYMPGPCFICHGGRLLPRYSDGRFPPLVLNSSKMTLLEQSTFEFLPTGNAFSESRVTEDIREINLAAAEQYQTIENNGAGTSGAWSADFAREVAEVHYGGAGFPSEDYTNEEVPAGWTQAVFRPEGVELLYQQVVGPYCIGCHSLRGYTAGEDPTLDTVTINGQNVFAGNAVNFSSFEKFISFSDRITDLVYRRGVMPLSLRSYEAFWENPDGPPALLASFLPGFDVSVNGTVTQPGLPVARPGDDYISQSPAILNGSGSYFAKTYVWEIIEQPEGSNASLSDFRNAITTLTADTAGDYTIRLSVGNSRTDNASDAFSDTITITIDPLFPERGADINFADDVLPLLQTSLFNLRTCQSCHNDTPGSGITGIPLLFNDHPDLFSDVLGRVNLSVPQDSLLLRKPSQIQHGGGIRFDISEQEGREAFSMIYSWILNGAPCGTDMDVCSNQFR